MKTSYEARPTEWYSPRKPHDVYRFGSCVAVPVALERQDPTLATAEWMA